MIIGCDEVGRGSLAGPVFASAVCFDEDKFLRDHNFKQICDSKKLKPGQRTYLSKWIKQNATSYAIAQVSPKVIDRINIHQASLLAMTRAVEKVRAMQKTPFDVEVIVDGKFLLPHYEGKQRFLIGGDDLDKSISASSIVAKVARDLYMQKLHKKYVVYGFDQHKGYATLAHRQAILRHGLSPVHRQTFCSKLVK